jgi:hypothetical protein
MEENSKLKTQNSTSDRGFGQTATGIGGAQQLATAFDERFLLGLPNHLLRTPDTPLQVLMEPRQPTLFLGCFGVLMVEQVDDEHADTEVEALYRAPPPLGQQPAPRREQECERKEQATGAGH